MGLEIGEDGATDGRTVVKRTSDVAMVVTRVFDAPAAIVYKAWTTPDLFMRWWAPKSMGMTLLSCDLDVRVGGGYRLEFGRDGSTIMAFFGSYKAVEPNARLVWTNEESDEGALTTVTFEEQGGKTLLTFSEVYQSKAALDEAFVGMEGGMIEQFVQLDELLASLG